MLIEFDQNTIANMTAALEFVCKKLPAKNDNRASRKRIADAMVASGKAGRRTYADFVSAGFAVLDEIIKQPEVKRFGFRWLAFVAALRLR
ncbi:hypothetical protein [Bradyrhizobium sp. ARR65]|uniref:hypothetical protein n=1 Tax=Bradyrhizobium sp. ARR65 TaxID=1040989 RepID=UPI00046313D5|nr:hypothetical protein [Bradyrhizobium sp. ARR65]